jgi:hypothetical protein
MGIYALPLIYILIIVALLSACGSETYKEVFHDTRPHAEIVHEIKTEKGIVILFSEEQHVGVVEILPNGNGWSIVSSQSMNNNDAITQGLVNKGSDDEILYGRINDGNITEVKLIKENGDIIEATILEPNHSFWYLQWKYDNAKLIGYSAEGKVLYQSSFLK